MSELITVEGFVLTKQQLKTKYGFALCYWLTSDLGPIQVMVEQQEAVFFVLSSDLLQILALLKSDNILLRTQALGLKSFDQQAISGCYFSTLHGFYQAKKIIQQAGFRLFEADVRHCDRFLMERFIRGSVLVQGQAIKKQGYLTLQQAKMKPSTYQPNFSVVSLDIECSGQGILFSVGLYSDDFYVVIMVGAPQHSEQNIVWVSDEEQLLVQLQRYFDERDPDVIIGWNVIDFDMSLLYRRAEQLGVPLYLGRAQQAMQLSERAVGKLLLPGRVVLDGIDTLKNATYHFNSFSLASVAEQLIGEKKLIESDDRLAEIEHQFKYDKLALAKYNLKDCQLVWDIFKQEKLIDFAILRTQLTGLELERQGGSVAAFVNLYLPLMHRSGYVAPNLGDHNHHFNSPGGYVMNSQPGLYQNVIVLDFKSLYPSIIRTFLIDPIGMVEGLLAPTQSIAGFHDAYFSRTAHHLPNLIATLWQARDVAKQQKNKMLSQAIKIIMNSFYGVLGSTGCRFYDPRLSSSITLRGHEIMLATRAEIERLGYQVIYGDTDSTFVQLASELSAEECKKIGFLLQKKINNFWCDYCEKKYKIASYLEIEFETLYSPFFMPTIRGSLEGSKKRYVGQVSDANGDHLVFKGMETVRSDWTELAREFQYNLFTLIFAGDSVEVYIKQVISDLMAGRLNHLLLYKKRLRQHLSEYVKNIPPHAQAAQKMSMKYPEKTPKRGQWIEYVITLDGPVVATEKPLKLNLQHYLEKQLQPIADSILPTLNMSFAQFLSGQVNLFEN